MLCVISLSLIVVARTNVCESKKNMSVSMCIRANVYIYYMHESVPVPVSASASVSVSIRAFALCYDCNTQFYRIQTADSEMEHFPDRIVSFKF